MAKNILQSSIEVDYYNKLSLIPIYFYIAAQAALLNNLLFSFFMQLFLTNFQHSEILLEFVTFDISLVAAGFKASYESYAYTNDLVTKKLVLTYGSIIDMIKIARADKF